MRIRDVMTTDVVVAKPDTPFPDLVDLLITNDVSGIPIVDGDGSLVGIVTEADLVSKQAFGGRRRRPLEVIADLVSGGETAWAVKAKAHLASQLMTSSKLVTAAPAEDIRVAARRLIESDVKRLPVVESGGRLAGIVSRTDLLRALHRTDEELRRAVAEAFADPLRSPEHTEVDIDVHEGIVSLAGTADYPADVSVLTAVVWSISGVVDVNNEVMARHPDPKV